MPCDSTFVDNGTVFVTFVAPLTVADALIGLDGVTVFDIVFGTEDAVRLDAFVARAMFVVVVAVCIAAMVAGFVVGGVEDGGATATAAAFVVVIGTFMRTVAADAEGPAAAGALFEASEDTAVDAATETFGGGAVAFEAIGTALGAGAKRTESAGMAAGDARGIGDT